MVQVEILSESDYVKWVSTMD